jgi:cellulose biosynthesis protein BcsQ
MIVSVTSPAHGQGNTTAALNIAMLLAETQGKRTCLTHLSAQSNTFFAYLGLERLTDKTCSPSQMVQLLREGAIAPQEMEDYCMKAGENLDIFSNNSQAVSSEDMDIIQKYVLGNLPHEVVVVDVDVNVESPIAKLAFEKSDLIVVTVTQSQYILDRYAQIFPDQDISKVMFFCNYFSQEVGTLAKLSKQLPGKNKVVGLRYSETLVKLANEGNLNKFLNAAKTIPLAGVENDLKNIALETASRLKMKGAWGKQGAQSSKAKPARKAKARGSKK